MIMVANSLWSKHPSWSNVITSLYNTLVITFLYYHSCIHIFIMTPMHSFSNSKCVWCCFTVHYKISGASLISRFCWYSIIHSSHSQPHSCNCHLLTFFITYICYILIISIKHETEYLIKCHSANLHVPIFHSILIIPGKPFSHTFILSLL